MKQSNKDKYIQKTCIKNLSIFLKKIQNYIYKILKKKIKYKKNKIKKNKIKKRSKK